MTTEPETPEGTWHVTSRWTTLVAGLLAALIAPLHAAAAAPPQAFPLSPAGVVGTITPTFAWAAVPSASYYLLTITTTNPLAPTRVWYTPAQAGCASGAGTCTASHTLPSGAGTWAVLTWNSDGYGPWSATTNFLIDVTAVPDISDPANPAATPVSPVGAVATLSPAFAWNAAASATWFQFSVVDMFSHSREYWYTPLQACAATPCTATPSTVLPPGPTRWTVRAWTPAGHGPWSAGMDFEPANQPPPQVAPVKPVGTILTAAPSFTWTAAPGTSYYLLAITDRHDVRTDTWYRPSAVGCVSGTGTCTARLVKTILPGQARWSVVAWNGAGYSPWSASSNFVVQAPDRSLFPAPPPGPVGPTPTRTPTYLWSPLVGALTYELEVTDALGAVQVFPYSSDQTCDVSCTATPLVELPVGLSQWRVRGWTWLDWTAWMTPLEFNPADGLPDRVIPVAPTGNINSATPTFSWNAVAASHYLLRVIDRDDAVVQRWYRPAEVGCSAGTGVCSVVASGPRPLGPSRWSVIAWNGSGYGPWSAESHFVVEIPDPLAGVPIPVAPVGVLTTQQIEYWWTRVPDAVLYRLSVTSNGGAPTETWYSAAALGCAGAAAQCGTVQATGLPNGAAAWRVQAWTPTGHGNWSTPVGISVIVAAPAQPVGLSPSGTSDAVPSFSWTASANATLYLVLVDDSTGNRVAKWLTPLQAGCGGGTDTCTLSPGVVLASGVGHWGVIAWNPTGYSPWSLTLTFTVP
jgi:hypothetical protein